MNVGVNVSEDPALQIGVNKIAGMGTQHTKTGIAPAAGDNPPAIPVPVPYAVYPSMSINRCIFLILEGDGAQAPFRLF